MHDRPFTRFRLAIAVGLDGDIGVPLNSSNRCAKSVPTLSWYIASLGWAHALNGNDRLALSFYNQALALEAFDLFSLYQLGQYYYMVETAAALGSTSNVSSTPISRVPTPSKCASSLDSQGRWLDRCVCLRFSIFHGALAMHHGKSTIMCRAT